MKMEGLRGLLVKMAGEGGMETGGLSYGCLNTLLSIADLCRSEGKGPKRAS